tara:strand:+ start:455 stop:730 length:276 start_codon:yes stop_codon:yes gene_type:complete
MIFQTKSMGYKKININYNNQSLKININELWYFQRLLQTINIYYKKDQNINKSILLKIPGTGKYLKLGIKNFIQINNAVKDKIELYKNNLHI